MTLPLSSRAVTGAGGRIRSTYRSPNRVVGTITAVTLAGRSLTMPGWMASVSTAPLPSALIERTSPT